MISKIISIATCRLPKETGVHSEIVLLIERQQLRLSVSKATISELKHSSKGDTGGKVHFRNYIMLLVRALTLPREKAF